MTDRYAVIGNPVAHSQSPHIHRMFADALGEDMEYGMVLGRPGRFADDVRDFRRSGGRGLNVTVPFKLDAYDYATRRSERATKAGAVNTLQFDGDDVFGDNTDGAGLVRDIRDGFGFAIAGARVVLMGAGGAARGALLPLLAERPARIAIVNRTVARRRRSRRAFEPRGRRVAARRRVRRRMPAGTFDLVINATSASLADALPPLPPDVFARARSPTTWCTAHGRRRFIAYALANGAGRAVDGLGMLVEQAAESFFLWRGVRPATGPVLAALRERDAEAAGAKRGDNGATVARAEDAMINKIVLSAAEAVADIHDGATVMIGGFGTAGMPSELIDALIEQGARDLTIVNNNAGNGDTGLAALLKTKRVRKIICSFPRQTDSWVFDALYRAGEIELELVPQGNLAERIRAAGAGIGAFFTPDRLRHAARRGQGDARDRRPQLRARVSDPRRLRADQGGPRRPLGQPRLSQDGAQLRADHGQSRRSARSRRCARSSTSAASIRRRSSRPESSSSASSKLPAGALAEPQAAA